MTQEEKAKNYDIALDKIKRLLGTGSNCSREDLEHVFPELAESEDEMMVKFIKNQLFNIKETITENYELGAKLTKAIDWLEKQQKPIKEHDVCDFCEDRYGCVNHCPMKLIEEEKPADKIESKFKEGDWVVVDDGRIGRIIECTKDFADVDLECSCLSTRVNDIRSWTIQDARCGDILVHNGCTFIFMGVKNGIVQALEKNLLEGTNPVCFGDPDRDGDYYPATKEQRDQLEKAIVNAGYKWNKEERKLEKIEQKPAEWHREDEQNLNACLGFIPDEYLRRWLTDVIRVKYDKSAWSEADEEIKKKVIHSLSLDGRISNTELTDIYNWLKSLKDRVQPKQEWSEEDSFILEKIKYEIRIRKDDYESKDAFKCVVECEKELDWLKSLKSHSRWKPSEEQMNTLEHYMHTLTCNEHKEILFGLYTDLKKLKE